LSNSGNNNNISTNIPIKERALVLQGGGSLGAYAAGAYKALYELLSKKDAKEGKEKSTTLTSYCIYCKREIREIENLNNEKARLEALITGFKSSNEEYLDKIKKTSEDKAKDILTNDKLILKFATLSIVESLRSNPEL
jgi:ATP-dependent protease HslVU (ClpYQ) peptidase subunit